MIGFLILIGAVGIVASVIWGLCDDDDSDDLYDTTFLRMTRIGSERNMFTFLGNQVKIRT